MNRDIRNRDRTGIIFLMLLIGAVFITDVYLEFSRAGFFNKSSAPEQPLHNISPAEYRELSPVDVHDHGTETAVLDAVPDRVRRDIYFDPGLIFYLFVSFAFYINVRLRNVIRSGPLIFLNILNVPTEFIDKAFPRPPPKVSVLT